MYNLKRSFILYALLLISFLLQISVARCTGWFPDLVLLVLVFTAVFRGLTAGLQVAVVAGFLRGIFSAYAFPLYILLFPAVSIGSYMVASMLYRQSSFVQMFIVGIAVFLSSAAHLFYLNIISGNDLGFMVFANNWRSMFVTIITAPLVFLIFNRITESRSV